MSIAAPTIMAEIIRPIVTRLAIFWRPSISRASLIASTRKRRRFSVTASISLFSRRGSFSPNCLSSSRLSNMRPGEKLLSIFWRMMSEAFRRIEAFGSKSGSSRRETSSTFNRVLLSMVSSRGSR